MTLGRYCCLVAMIFLVSSPLVKAGLPASSYGVWDQGFQLDAADYPFLRGAGYTQKWNEVEKEPGVFDWSTLDQATQKALKSNTYIFLSISVGPDAPMWIYENGVPKVVTDDQADLKRWKAYPYYLSADYKKFFNRLITEFGNHIRSYPAEQQERIAFIQVKTGCAEDEVAYKGTPQDSAYTLLRNSAEWRDFRLDSFALFVATFQPSNGDRKFDLLFNVIGRADELAGKFNFGVEWDWVTSHINGGFGIKNGALSRGHHLNGELAFHKQWAPYLLDSKGATLFRRSEMDFGWTRSLYKINVPLNFYWGAINALNAGHSIWDVEASAIKASKEEGFDFSFYFFNRYAGQIRPETATDVFCALHKGLDASDINAYPEHIYGEATPKNAERMLKICALFEKYGAAVDDKDALTMGQVKQRRSQTGLNDVGWQIWPDNYGRFLYQIDADATSIPLWRVGGPITPSSPIYARFARGFEHATGKDALYFKLHENFKKDTAPQTMTFNIIWYDQTEGSTWKLVYDAGGAEMKSAIAVTGTGDKQWHETTVTVTDAVLARGGISGSDLALINTDDKDDIFSLVEMHRGAAVERPSALNKK